jgi:hypothetical protein
MKKQKKTVKWKKHKENHTTTKNPAAAALTGRPSVAPTRAERGSVPLTGGA